MISDRKLEHLLICENYDVEFKNKTTGFEDVELIHNVLPEIDKNEIDLSTSVFGKKLDSPLFITAITGGHPAAKSINKQLAIAAENNNIALGVGSQRAACEHPELEDTYTVVRENAPDCLLVGKELQNITGSPTIDGYQSGDKNSVVAQIKALYNVLFAQGIAYINPPASFETIGQKVRLPHDVLVHKQGTCLDMAILFAAGIESMGLNPLIVLSDKDIQLYSSIEKQFKK